MEETKEEGSDEEKQEGEGEGEKKKKKKKKNKKKKAAEQGEGEKKEGDGEKKVEANGVEGVEQPETQTNEIFRCLGGWTKPVKYKFPNNQFQGYPVNQIQEYKVPRVKSEELKAKEAIMEERVQYLRKAAEIQRQVRRFAQNIIRPGRRLIDICEAL